jgi:hypothetical protein
MGVDHARDLAALNTPRLMCRLADSQLAGSHPVLERPSANSQQGCRGLLAEKFIRSDVYGLILVCHCFFSFCVSSAGRHGPAVLSE